MKLRKTEEDRQTAALQRRQRADERQQARAAARERLSGELRNRRERLEATTTLAGLGVMVHEGNVYRQSLGGVSKAPILGPLAGARAEVTGGHAGHRRSDGRRTADAVVATAVLGPVGLLAAASRKISKGTAFVIFANGSLHERELPNAQAIVKAQADVVRFNALAGTVPIGDTLLD